MITADTRLSFACPFCGLVVTVADSEGGAMVLHGLPMCRRFEALEADEFLKQCREKLPEVGRA